MLPLQSHSLPHTHEKRSIKVFGIELIGLPPWLQLSICVGGIMFFFCAYAYLQEAIFEVDGFDFGWYLTLVQFALYSLMARTERHIFRDYERRSPMNNYFTIAFFIVATMGLSNTACTYLSYPTQVMFKSSKLIPVMIGGKLILGKHYKIMEYLSAICVVIGLCGLTLAEVYTAPSFDPTGVIIICGALLSDAFISNLQEKTMKDYDVGQREMVYFSHLIGCAYLFLYLLVSGELFTAYSFCMENTYVYVYMALFAFFGYFGITFVLAMLKIFDSFLAMTVTSCRKVVTIMLSFVFFPKPISAQYFFALTVIFFGIGLHIYSKNTKVINNYLRERGIRVPPILQSLLS